MRLHQFPQQEDQIASLYTTWGPLFYPWCRQIPHWNQWEACLCKDCRIGNSVITELESSRKPHLAAPLSVVLCPPSGWIPNQNKQKYNNDVKFLLPLVHKLLKIHHCTYCVKVCIKFLPVNGRLHIKVTKSKESIRGEQGESIPLQIRRRLPSNNGHVKSFKGFMQTGVFCCLVSPGVSIGETVSPAAERTRGLFFCMVQIQGIVL